MMSRRRGFLIKHRLSTLFRRFFRRNHYHQLERTETEPPKAVSWIINCAQHLRTKALAVVSRNGHHSARGYIRVGAEPVPVPKGHIAVYVGRQDGDSQRMLVPVVFINHPLFVDLLKESEEEYGFDHPGGLKIPCRVAEFEHVQTRIKAVHCTRKLQVRRRSKRSTL